MPVCVYDVGALNVSVKYLWQKVKPSGPYYYRRRYPGEIKTIFHSRGELVGDYHAVSLKTRDKDLAVKRVIQLSKQDDELWDKMRKGVDVSDSRGKAEALLNQYGLQALPMDAQPSLQPNIDAFIDHLQSRVPIAEDSSAMDSEGGFTQADPKEHLSGHEYRALQILNGREVIYLSDAKSLYLSTRKQDRKTRNSTNRSFDLVFDLLGDRPIAEYSRREVSSVIKNALDIGLKTATVRRNLGTIRAAVNEAIREYELDDVRNPFTDFKIPNLGEDSEDRTALTEEQFNKLVRYVNENSGSTSNMIGMLMYTGARVSEIAGLFIEDVILDAEVPHIIIHKNTLRRIKTKASQRKVPLVGEALLSAKRALSEAKGSKYLFPRYMADNQVKNDGASAAMCGVMERLDCQTPHWLRHTLRTKLKNADVPEPRIKELQGWSRESIADQYGEQTALRNLEADLKKLCS